MTRPVRVVHVGLVLTTMCTIVATDSLTARQFTEEQELVRRFLESGTPELKTYTARRVLSAATGGGMEAHLEAWTRLDADGRFHFEVVCSRGSSLIRSHVLVAALEAEQRSRSDGGHHRAAVTSDNYALTLGAARTGGLREVRLAPRRPSQLLIDGRVLVRSETGDMVRIEGRLSENPSWWTRRVDIVRRYERINGVRVPVEMTSTADVRVAGTSTFAMSYEYTAINGRRLTTRAHAGCSVGESG